MRSYELSCVHGIGHSGGVHGCDGCCALIAGPAEQRAIKRIVDKIREVYVDSELEEWGSFEYTEDIIELIEREQK